ncbi:MAG: hypothetical protein AAF355_07085 [Myxococcota bacterium]
MIDRSEELRARLRRDPGDTEAYHALKALYRDQTDYPSLVNLIEGWAAKSVDANESAEAFHEASKIAEQQLQNRSRTTQLLSRALERNPLHGKAWGSLVRVHAATGDTRRIISAYERQIRALSQIHVDEQTIAPLHLELGQLWEQGLERADRAIEQYRHAFQKDPGLVPALYAARELYKQTGNLHEAAVLYDLEAEAEPDPDRKLALHLEVARIRSEELSDLSGAEESLRRALALSPEDLSVMHDMVSLLLRRANGAGNNPAMVRDRMSAADLLTQMATMLPSEQAIAYCESALEVVPNHDEALDLLEVLATHPEDRRRLPHRWVAYLRASPETSKAADRRVQLGQAYVQAGQPQDAIDCLELLLEVGNPQAAKVLVGAYQTLERETDAANALAVSAQELIPEERIPLVREAMHLLRQAENDKEASKRAHELLTLVPHDEEALAYLQDECRTPGDKSQLHHVIENAISSWQLVLHRDPANQGAFESLGALLEQQEQWDQLAYMLGQQALAATDLDTKAKVYRRLASIHLTQRSDPHEASVVLRKLRKLLPHDDEVRTALSEALLKSGATADVASLLQEQIDAEHEPERRAELRRILAEHLERELDQDTEAFAVASQILADLPNDEDALKRMERIDARLGNYERLVDTLSYRAKSADGETQIELYSAIGVLAEEHLKEPERAIDAYQRVLELDPDHDPSIEALDALLERAGRYRELIMVLQDRAEREDNAEVRSTLYHRIASIMRHGTGDEEAAASTYRKLLAIRGDEEALRYLADLARRRQQWPELVRYGGELVDHLNSSEEATDLLFEIATVYIEKLEQPRLGVEKLRILVNELDSGHQEALALMVNTGEDLEDSVTISEALSKQLSITDDPSLRVPIAKRLAQVYEKELRDTPSAIEALFAWVDADVTAPEPHRQLVPLLESEARWEELRGSFDILCALEVDGPAIARWVQRSAELCVRLGDVDGAWERLRVQTEAGDSDCEGALRALARSVSRSEELAQLYRTLAKNQNELEDKASWWKKAAEIHDADVGDSELAIEAALHSFFCDTSNLQLVAYIENLMERSGLWHKLSAVYEALVREQKSPADRARTYRRQASVLEDKAKSNADAFQAMLLAYETDPTDEEVRLELERLGSSWPQSAQILSVYDRRKAEAETDALRVEYICKAARWCSSILGDAQQANSYLAQGVALCARAPELMPVLETCAVKMDSEQELPLESSAIRDLAMLYRRIGEHASDDRRTSTRLLMESGRLFETWLDEPATALEVLIHAVELDPSAAEVLRQVAGLAKRCGEAEALQELLERLAREALDSNVAETLLRCRAELLTTVLAHFDTAANVYEQLRVLLPADREIAFRLRESLQKAARYDDLLVAVERELVTTSNPLERHDLLQIIAETWEFCLNNRWEGLDAWKRLLNEFPKDREALEATKRLAPRSVASDELPTADHEPTPAVFMISDELQIHIDSQPTPQLHRLAEMLAAQTGSVEGISLEAGELTTTPTRRSHLPDGFESLAASSGEEST